MVTPPVEEPIPVSEPAPTPAVPEVFEPVVSSPPEATDGTEAVPPVVPETAPEPSPLEPEPETKTETDVS